MATTFASIAAVASVALAALVVVLPPRTGRWVAGPAVLAAVAAGCILVAFAAFEDNSRHPASWPAGLAVVFVPPLIVAALLLVSRRVGHWVAALLVLVLAVSAVFGTTVVRDAAACDDDDCVPAPLPLAIMLLACPLLAGAAAGWRWRIEPPGAPPHSR